MNIRSGEPGDVWLCRNTPLIFPIIFGNIDGNNLQYLSIYDADCYHIDINYSEFKLYSRPKKYLDTIRGEISDFDNGDNCEIWDYINTDEKKVNRMYVNRVEGGVVYGLKINQISRPGVEKSHIGKCISALIEEYNWQRKSLPVKPISIEEMTHFMDRIEVTSPKSPKKRKSIRRNRKGSKKRGKQKRSIRRNRKGSKKRGKKRRKSR